MEVKKERDWGLIIIIALVVLAAGYIFFALIEQQADINQLKREKQAVLEEIEKEEKDLKKMQQLSKQTQSLDYIEKQAREKLGMVRPDETVYIDIGKSEN